MKRNVTLDQVKRELRARVCQHCPLRHPGEPGDRVNPDVPLDCETSCELFEHLPRLTELAVQLDPMIQSVPAALQRKITRAIESIHESRKGFDGRSSPLNRHRRCVVRTLTELVEQ
jgi:hypothetical protein